MENHRPHHLRSTELNDHQAKLDRTEHKPGSSAFKTPLNRQNHDRLMFGGHSKANGKGLESNQDPESVLNWLADVTTQSGNGTGRRRLIRKEHGKGFILGFPPSIHYFSRHFFDLATDSDGSEIGIAQLTTPPPLKKRFTRNIQGSQYSKGKRKRSLSVDSSILDSPVRKVMQVLDTPIKSHNRNRSSRDIDDMHTSGLMNGYANSPTPKKRYEKRARHKTREDRYEPKANGTKPKAKRTKATSTKKQKPTRGNANVGQDLMQSFSSKSIVQERLTVSLHAPSRTYHIDKTRFVPIVESGYSTTAVPPLPLDDVAVSLS